ncbi:uncharacterized protein TNCV_2423541 [Trichonephila clavipes]|nr:uncharacterized protein TNCV_2423541 [Trichonephila clavipes]
MNELNTRFVYGLRLIGRGVSAGRKLCAVLNLPPFLSKLAFRQQEKKLLSAAISIGEKKGMTQQKDLHSAWNRLGLIVFLRGRKIIECYARYTDYNGDGDSKAFDAVKDIYGKDSVTKLECIGHIQKRVGTRLRKLKSRNKGLGGKGKLTDGLINKLQNYYGIAIRSKIGNLDKMQSAVIAAFFHCCTSKHGQCPVGDESWCKFQRATASNIVYQDKSLGLPQNIVNTIKPLYMDLCDRNLLREQGHHILSNNRFFNFSSKK